MDTKNAKTKRIEASLLLLGGGSGSRMGGNKLFLSLDGRPVLERFLSSLSPIFSGTVICAGAKEGKRVASVFEHGGASITEDRERGRGPLEGLRQGLSAMDTEWGFLLGVDMLGVMEAVVRQMWALTTEASDVSVFVRNGRKIALHAFYRRTCIPHIDAAIAGKERSVRGGARIISFFSNVNVREITPAELSHLPGYMRSFDNCNTPGELERSALESGGFSKG